MLAVSEDVCDMVAEELGDAPWDKEAEGLGVTESVTVGVDVEESETVGDGDSDAVDVEEGKSASDPLKMMVLNTATGDNVGEGDGVMSDELPNDVELLLPSTVVELLSVVVFVTNVSFTATNGAATTTTSIFMASTEYPKSNVVLLSDTAATT